MTNQEKHALIAEELGGWEWVQLRTPTDSRYAGRKLLFDATNSRMYRAADMSAPIDPVCSCPDYSNDLAACAVVERAIGEMGLGVQYVNCLKFVLFGMTSADLFLFVRASAQDRVDAMVMLISATRETRRAQQRAEANASSPG